MTSTCTDSTWDSASVCSSSPEYISHGENVVMFKALRAFVNTMPSKTEMSIPAMALLDLVQFTMNLQARCDYLADAATKYQRSLKISEIMMRDACPKLCTSHELFLAAFKAAEPEADKVKLHEYAATESSDMDLNHWIACALAGLEPTLDSRATSISRSESARRLYTSPRITPELALEINGSLRALDLFESGQEVDWRLPKRVSALLEYAPGLDIGYDLSCDKNSVVSPPDGDKNIASQHSYSGCGSYLKDLKDFFITPGNHCNEANPEDSFQFSSKGILNGPGFGPVVASVRWCQETGHPGAGEQGGIQATRITLRARKPSLASGGASPQGVLCFSERTLCKRCILSSSTVEHCVFQPGGL